MPAQFVSNNAYSTIATLGALSGTGTGTCAVQSGHGTRFPSPTAGDYFLATLQDASGNIEIIQITGRSTDTLTIGARGQESTTARAWAVNDVIELRFTAATTVTTAGTQTLTNKTLTSPTISGGSISSLTTDLAVSDGGTGVSTLTGIAYGNGTSAFTAATAAQVGTVINVTGLVKGAGAAALSAATAGTDYVAPGTATNFTATQRADYNTTTATSSYNFAGADQIVNITLTTATTVTFGAPSGLVTGAYYTFILTAGDTSARTYAWNAAYKFPAATSPLSTATATSGACDIITFIALSATTAAYIGHQADLR